jgi:hypothetical protein
MDLEIRQSGQEGPDPDPMSAVVAIASMTRKPKPQILTAYEDLAAERLPEGGLDPLIDPEHFMPDGRFTGRWMVQESWLPSALQIYHRQVVSELSREAVRALRLIVWRYDVDSGHDPVRSQRLAVWSLDGTDWQSVLPPLNSRTYRPELLGFEPSQVEEIKSLIADPVVREPLGHSLFREAWNRRRGDERSSLVIGLASAEAAVKEFIVALEPGASWLIANVPSPPLLTLLDEYVPRLIMDKGLRPYLVKSPKDEIYEVIKKGVSVRNKVAHGRDHRIRHDFLDSTLLAVRDALWMLDVFRGHDWARERVRPTVLAEWDRPRR